MNPQDIPPSQVTVDCILRYSPTMPKMGQAAVLQGNLIFLTKNHQGTALMFNAPIHFDGDPVSGENPRFVLRKIWHEVWKLSPSFSHELLHAFITIVGVPEEAWP